MSFFFLTGHSLSSLVGTWQAGVLPLVSEVSERECAWCVTLSDTAVPMQFHSFTLTRHQFRKYAFSIAKAGAHVMLWLSTAVRC